MIKRCFSCDKPILKDKGDENNKVDHNRDDMPIEAACLTVSKSGTILLKGEPGTTYEISLCEACISKHSDSILKVNKEGDYVGRLADDLI